MPKSPNALRETSFSLREKRSSATSRRDSTSAVTRPSDSPRSEQARKNRHQEQMKCNAFEKPNHTVGSVAHLCWPFLLGKWAARTPSLPLLFEYRIFGRRKDLTWRLVTPRPTSQFTPRGYFSQHTREQLARPEVVYPWRHGRTLGLAPPSSLALHSLAS